MASRDYPLPPPSTIQHPFRRLGPLLSTPPDAWARIPLSFVLKDAFRLHTLVALGAAAQIGLAALLPRRWAYVPAAATLGAAIVSTLLQLTVFRHTHALRAGVVPGRAMAWPPTGLVADEDQEPAAAPPPLVVFHFGARVNHPLGLLAPGGRTLTAFFKTILANLSADQKGEAAQADHKAQNPPSRYGLLGASLYRGGERPAHDTILMVLYFRDVAGLQRFARDPLHTQAQHWLADPAYAHIAAFHETFCVPSGAYETMYLNAAPTLLGNTHWVPADAAGDDAGVTDTTTTTMTTTTPATPVWRNALVDADHHRLQTMTARLGQGP